MSWKAPISFDLELRARGNALVEGLLPSNGSERTKEWSGRELATVFLSKNGEPPQSTALLGAIDLVVC